MRVAALAFLPAVLLAQVPDADLAQAASALRERLVACRRELHADPELSNREPARRRGWRNG